MRTLASCALLCLAGALDVFCTIAFLVQRKVASLGNWSQYLTDIKQNGLDNLLLLLLRFILDGVLVSVALRLGRVPKPQDRRPTEGLNQTLLPTTVVVHSNLSRDGLPLIKNVLGPEGRRNASRVAKQKKIIDSKQRADFRKNLCLALIFAFHMACSIYIGIKVIVFDFKSTAEAIFLSIAPVWIYLEFAAWKLLVEGITKVRGKLFSGIHHHPLVLTAMPCNCVTSATSRSESDKDGDAMLVTLMCVPTVQERRTGAGLRACFEGTKGSERKRKSHHADTFGVR